MKGADVEQSHEDEWIYPQNCKLAPFAIDILDAIVFLSQSTIGCVKEDFPFAQSYSTRIPAS